MHMSIWTLIVHSISLWGWKANTRYIWYHLRNQREYWIKLSLKFSESWQYYAEIFVQEKKFSYAYTDDETGNIVLLEWVLPSVLNFEFINFIRGDIQERKSTYVFQSVISRSKSYEQLEVPSHLFGESIVYLQGNAICL